MSNTEIMNQMTTELDNFLNKDAPDRDSREIGLILIVYPFHAERGQVHIGTNGAAEPEVVEIMRKMVAHYDMNQPEVANENEVMQ